MDENLRINKPVHRSGCMCVSVCWVGGRHVCVYHFVCVCVCSQLAPVWLTDWFKFETTILCRFHSTFISLPKFALFIVNYFEGKSAYIKPIKWMPDFCFISLQETPTRPTRAAFFVTSLSSLWPSARLTQNEEENEENRNRVCRSLCLFTVSNKSGWLIKDQMQKSAFCICVSVHGCTGGDYLKCMISGGGPLSARFIPIYFYTLTLWPFNSSSITH